MPVRTAAAAGADLFHVQGERNAERLRGWYEEVKAKMPRAQVWVHVFLPACACPQHDVPNECLP